MSRFRSGTSLVTARWNSRRSLRLSIPSGWSAIRRGLLVIWAPKPTTSTWITSRRIPVGRGPSRRGGLRRWKWRRCSRGTESRSSTTSRRVTAPHPSGPPGPTQPFDHMLHIHAIWQAGGYPTYHHDMFQLGYDSPTCPPDGIPDPEFSPYHREVFQFLANADRHRPRRS